MNHETRAFPHVRLAEDAILVDFDGTLVDIAQTPEAVEVPDGLAAMLERLCARASGAVAVVSGRALSDLEAFLAGFSGTLIGSHGAERRGGRTPEPPKGLASLQSDVRRVALVEGLLAEVKTFGAALHYRRAPERREAARAAAEALALAYPAFTLQTAKMAFELKPRGADKGAAIAALLAEPAFAGRRPVYLGDDTTDEAAMEWSLAQGGLAVKVGPGDSVARVRLDGPGEVRAWLALLAEGG